MCSSVRMFMLTLALEIASCVPRFIQGKRLRA
jgi:hypothetical protein